MLVQFRLRPLVLAAVCFAAVSSSFAQDDAGRSKFSNLINFDVLADNYAKFLARKYDLNEEQDKFTQKLLHDKAREFLGRHEQDVRGVIDQLFALRTGGQMSQDELMAWGKRVAPLYEEAKTVLTESNQQWREILNENQRRIHDEDLKLMQQSFQTTDDQIQRIVAGQMTVEEFRNQTRNPGRPQAKPNPPATVAQTSPPPAPPPPVVSETPSAAERNFRNGIRPGGGAPQPGAPERPAVAAGNPPPQPDPQTGAVVENPEGQPEAVVEQPVMEGAHPPVEHAPPPNRTRGVREQPAPPAAANPPSPPPGKDFESQWETYTRQFIQKYKLDEAQTLAAEKILRECQEKGRRHMALRKTDVERLDQKLEELKKSNDKNKTQELAKLNQQRAKMLEPITRIFEKELKPGLDKIPTLAQRQAAETAGNKSGKAAPSANPANKNPAATPVKKKDND